ncbi:MAG TPA: aldose 1-epimerase [Pararhizobium sp.]|uniref:aldose 1-epimerase n=1 Tax=Pararhizobium sp. TaxID=1977563 RepID=UPI002BDCBD10|nr:aldose 1-epimerase [Pararhizobium sp.]HTO30505.1 aldose 1-epimerase [Pararhizobium sp.]
MTAEDVIRLEKDGLTVDVSPLGGAILSARWHGIPVLAPAPSPGLASQVLGTEACFPLVPFGNRVENNAFRFDGRDYGLTANTADPLILHGDGWLRRWAVAEQEPHRIVFRYHHEADAASPFAYEAVETIALGDDSLSLSLGVTNRAKQTLPYGLGFHPYFPRTPATRIQVNVNRFWTERTGHLPGEAGPLPPDFDIAAGATLPERWLNNAFDGWDGTARIEWPEHNLALSLEADPALGHIVIYAPSSMDAFFCLEPMTHRPNAHAEPTGSGLVPLEDGENLSAGISLRVQALTP